MGVAGAVTAEAILTSLRKHGVLKAAHRKTIQKNVFAVFFGVWCLEVSDGRLGVSFGCLELSVGCLDLSFGCLELSFGWNTWKLHRGPTETKEGQKDVQKKIVNKSVYNMTRPNQQLWAPRNQGKYKVCRCIRGGAIYDYKKSTA